MELVENLEVLDSALINIDCVKILAEKKIAFVLDQLAGGIGGAESIFFTAYKLFPESSIYTTVLNKNIIPDEFKDININTSWIQNLPFSKRLYKYYFPLMPFAVEFMDIQEYDIVFSSHHCVAKGVIPRPDAVHICYCHSPARYIWDLFWTYSDLCRFNPYKAMISSIISSYLRVWDVACSNRVDYFLANSQYTQARIRKFYNRDAEVLFPPVDTQKFKHNEYKDYYLMAGRLVAYKGYELAINAFNESGRQLVIIGDGSEFNRLKKLAGPNISMTGRVSEETLINYMNNCKGFIFPGKEDFGIVMAEAQGAGKPVIAFKAGGALDILEEDATGVFFDELSIKALNRAISKSELIDWNPKYITNHSRKFDKQKFIERFKYIIDNAESFSRNTSLGGNTT